MDPCPFVRLIVEGMALKLPAVARPVAGTGVHPSATPCYCALQLQDLPSCTQTAPLPLVVDPTSTTNLIEPPVSTATGAPSSSPVIISLDQASLQKLSGKRAVLTISVYTGRNGSICGLNSGRLLGRVRIEVGLDAAQTRPTVAQNGWVSVGAGRCTARMHLVVRFEPDPRFVFQFGGEPECSPVVYQIQGARGRGSGQNGSIRQPVFSCRFNVDRCRNTRSRSVNLSQNTVYRERNEGT